MATATQENLTEEGVSLTEAAAERVREFMARDGGIGLRLSVKRTGCSGWAYDVGLAHEAAAEDHVFEDRGIQVIVDDKALSMVAGTRIDFVHQGLVREFRFTNPNVTGECGCGESFTVGA
ncbi:iron-sulfur cluster assembly accessory protein [Wenzhouxiangella sp. AB-CW3]|uniref:HesB/IscA family protein n=1 Tax=Wenzhouxiangella sp. AB-CW3 TaxID=2771012 RepID=UPI00168A6F3F|nr:iron-sulfur cluster assembly accessory protein [Wenzhouxiangella sp. AB-CW3]QOC23738.1 iron-sulfur cluster assembly accessory protein [Wenzhouxiangella sp. AB-CW3]